MEKGCMHYASTYAYDSGLLDIIVVNSFRGKGKNAFCWPRRAQEKIQNREFSIIPSKQSSHFDDITLDDPRVETALYKQPASVAGRCSGRNKRDPSDLEMCMLYTANYADHF